MMLKRFSSSIRTQFLIVMLLLIVVPVIIGAIVTYHYFGGYITDNQKEDIAILADGNLFALQNYLSGQRKIAALIANDPSIRNLAANVQKYSTGNSLSTNNVRTYLQSELNAAKLFLNNLEPTPAYLVDAKTGAILLQSGTLSSKLSAAKFDAPAIVQFINKIIAQRLISVSEYTYSTLLNRSTFFIGAPVLDRKNRVVAVVLLEEPPHVLAQHINGKFASSKAAETYLLNDNGRVLVYVSASGAKNTENLKADARLYKTTGTFFSRDLNNEAALTSVNKLDLNEIFGISRQWYLVTQIPKKALAGPFGNLRLFLILIVLFLCSLGFFIVFWLSSLVSRPIETINYTLNEVTQGNLKVDVPVFDYGNELDELSENLKIMVNRLHEQISDVGEHINNISASSAEISATISQVTASSSETASAITETASSSEEVAQLAKSFDEKARDALTLSNETADASEKSQQAIQAIYNVIGQVKTQIDEVASSMVNLSKQSQTISEITSVVQEIAEQSNILAINASIEATKAGEYGRSFAVVANEVRNLAEQSKKATQQIRSILDAIQESITRSVMQVEQTNKVVNEGSTHMSMVNNAVELLAGSIDKMIQLVAEVAESSHEQLEGTSQIKEAMENIKQATAQNLDGMRQMEEVITGLKQTAVNLKELISKYNL